MIEDASHIVQTIWLIGASRRGNENDRSLIMRKKSFGPSPVREKAMPAPMMCEVGSRRRQQ